MASQLAAMLQSSITSRASMSSTLPFRGQTSTAWVSCAQFKSFTTRSLLPPLPTRNGVLPRCASRATIRPFPHTRDTASITARLPRIARRKFHWSRPKRTNTGNGTRQDTKIEEEPTTLRARFRKLSREYGWAAVGVYAALSILDFPFCFMLVRIVGTDRIAEIEHWAVSHIETAIPQGIKDRWSDYRAAVKQSEAEHFGNNDVSSNVEMIGWGVEEAEAKHKAEASLGTQLALAYAIHKSFIFARIPLTAAVTPKVVKVLRGWGWQIGKRTPKP